MKPDVIIHIVIITLVILLLSCFCSHSIVSAQSVPLRASVDELPLQVIRNPLNSSRFAIALDLSRDTNNLIVGDDQSTAYYRRDSTGQYENEASITNPYFSSTNTSNWGHLVAVSETPNVWATVYRASNGSKQWYLSVRVNDTFVNPRLIDSKCNGEIGTIGLSMLTNTLLVGCDTDIYYYNLTLSPTPGVSPLKTMGDAARDPALTMFNGWKLSITVDNESIVIRSEEEDWNTIGSSLKLDGSNILAADIWNNTFAIATLTRTVQIISLTNDGDIENNITLTPPAPATPGDLALGSNLLVVSYPSLRQVYFYNNLSIPSAPACLIASIPGSWPITSMSVSLGENSSTPTVAVGVMFSQNSSVPGTVYIFVNPCSLEQVSPTSSSSSLSTSSSVSSSSTPSSSSGSSSSSSSSTSNGNTACVSNLLISIGSQASCINGQWNIPGDAAVNSTIIIDGSEIVNIQGDFDLAGSALQVHQGTEEQGTIISVGGVAQIDGSLVIIVDGPLDGPVNLTLINASSVRGNFSDVRIIQQNTKNCRKAQAKPIYSKTGVIMQLTSTNTCNSAATRRNIIIAVVCSVFGLILITVIIIVALARLQRRGKFMWCFWARYGEHSRDILN